MTRFKSRKDRVHHALRLYHGIGTEDGEEWGREEIADFLDVKRKRVDEYLDETEQAREIKQAFDSIADETRRELIMEKRDRLRQLRDLEEELREVVEVVVTDFEFQEAELEVANAPGDNVKVAEDGGGTYTGEVPVPHRVKQVPEFDRLSAVWEEMRETEEELANLMGLNAPEELSVESTVTEQKFYKLGTDPAEEGMPEQEVEDLSEKDSV